MPFAASFSTPPLRRRALSQVHLVRENALRVIAARFAPRAEDCVLEVGPGTGNLTDHVAHGVRRLVCVEADRGFAASLKARYAALPHVQVVHGDILDFDAARFFSGEEKGSVRVLTNLPYHITSAFLEWLFERRALFFDAFVLLQREVAQKLLWDVPSERGWLPHRARFCAEISSVAKFSPASFSPQPQVASEMLHFKFRKNPCIDARDEGALFDLVGRGFSARRKTLWNNLRGWRGIAPARLERARQSLGWTASMRAEQLSLADFARLGEALLKEESP